MHLTPHGEFTRKVLHKSREGNGSTVGGAQQTTRPMVSADGMNGALLLRNRNSVNWSAIGDQLKRHKPGQQVRRIKLTDKVE